MTSYSNEDIVTRPVDDPLSRASGRTPKTITVREDQMQSAYGVLSSIAQYQFGSAKAADVRRALDADINWPYLSKLATTHAVEPIAYHTLQQTSADLLPPEVTSYIRDYQRSLKVRNTFIIREINKVTALFDALGIPALLLKGPALAKVAYGDVNLRRYIDIDVLIPGDHLDAAEEALLDNGYQLFDKVSRLGPYRRAVYHYLSQQRAFQRGNGMFNLDLHTRLMPPGMPYTVSFSELWGRSVRVALGQEAQARRFAAEDMLILLCYHGAKNQWSAFKHVYDVAALTVSADLDWDMVTERAQRVHAERMLGLGLLLVQRLAGDSIPPGVLSRLDIPEALRDVAPQLEAHMKRRGSNKRVSLSYTERVRLYLLLQDTVPNKLRYMLFSAARNVWDAWIK
jgi:hypothetical protein